MDNSTIYMNYNDTLSKASELRELAQRLQDTTAKPLEDTADNLGTVWTGDTAELYRRKLQRLSSTFSSRANVLNGFAGGLESSAERLRKVEELAISLFNRNGS